MKSLSTVANNLEGQPMFRLLDKVSAMERDGKDVLHFELGDPDFDTPEHIINAACKSLRHGETHYTSSMGLFEFREAVRDITHSSRGFRPDTNQILSTPGANAIIYFSIQCLVNPGEEVIVPDPGFPTYYSAIKALGAKDVRVQLKESNKFRMDPDDIEKHITKKTRLIIINSPSNPTGAVMTCDQIQRVAEIARDHDIYLLSDEIYSRMMYEEGCSFISPSYLDHCKEHTIILNGVSKAFAMTGWRLGVAIGPEAVIEKMGLLVQTIVSCVPPFIQRAGIEAINGDQKPIFAMVDEYNKRKEVLVNGLNSVKGIHCLTPGGAMYVFPNITGTGMNSQEFSDYVLDKAGIALLPGPNFGEFGEGFVRMCYASGVDVIQEAIRRLKKLFN